MTLTSGSTSPERSVSHPTLAIDEKKKAMSEIIEYRPINEDERIEIDQLAAKGLVLIGLQESAESSAILDGIKNYLNNFESSDDEEITDRAYELGSLLGNTIQKHYGWNWFCVEENTDDSFHCVASNKERACCACHEYIYTPY